MPTCFIVSPLSKQSPPKSAASRRGYTRAHFRRVLNELCIPAVEKIGFKPIPSDQPDLIDIDAKILKQLREADLVLCDISGLNPNVHYELGIRFAYEKPFALIKDRQTKEPFDLRRFQHYEYSPSRLLKDGEAVVAELADYLRKTLQRWRRRRLAPPPRRPRAADELLKGAAACGLRNVYPSRRGVKEEVAEAIFHSEERLWLLGIGLYQEFNLRKGAVTRLAAQLKRLCARTGPESPDWPPLRVMMLDPLSSIGVFRTFLECSEGQITDIIEAARDREFGGNPYFKQLVCNNFQNALDMLTAHGGFDDFVRFYAHTPTCWMVIADDTAYFQPYTFGNTPDNPPGNSIGHLMPVFKFEKGADDWPFDILRDHYNKLWLTTDSDLFHADAHARNRENILAQIFHRRMDWLEHIRGVILPSAIGSKASWEDRRRHPRQRCVSKVSLTIRFKSGRRQYTVRAKKTLDFSLRGMRVLLPPAAAAGGGWQPARGLTQREWGRVGEVRLEITEVKPQNYNAAVFVKRRLVDSCKGRFRLVYARPQGAEWVVGLEACR